MNVLAWFSRPGTASAFTPIEGIAHEWITSAAVIKIRVWVFIGNTVRLSTSRRRNEFSSSSVVGTMYALKSIFWKSEYSYDQNHWCPIVFSVIEGSFTSSIRYNSCKDGTAIKINTIAGSTVQIISIVCPWRRKRFLYLLVNNDPIIYPTKVVIITTIIIIWSWNIISCSISGADLSWNPSWFHVATSKWIFVLFWSLNPMHYSAKLDLAPTLLWLVILCSYDLLVAGLVVTLMMMVGLREMLLFVLWLFFLIW